MPYGNVSSYCNYSERGPRQVGATTKLKQSLPAINREAFTFQPELRSGYYTPMRERPFVEQSQGTLRPLAFEIKFRLGNGGNYCQRCVSAVVPFRSRVLSH